jgi:NitT/TauT family transport system permease protein
LGAGAGLLGGLALGLVRPLDRLMELTLELLRPIPSVAIIPIALIALGFGYRLEVAIVAFSCFWPVLILARSAVRSVEPRLIEVSRALRLSPAAAALKIVAPAAAPRLFVALRLATGVALVVAVTVEIAVNPQGLGYEAMTASQALRPALMLADILWIGVIGYALNVALLFAQRRLFPHEAAR